MKPRLLKFTCHSCGVRLAVPPEMAGLSDECPKCGVLVTAPLAPPQPPVEIPAEAEPAQAPEAAPPQAPQYVPPKAVEAAPKDAQAQMAALQKVLAPQAAAPQAPQYAPPKAAEAAPPQASLVPPKAPEVAPNDAQAQMAALQKQLGAKPPPMDAPEPVVPSPVDAQSQVAELQKMLGGKPKSSTGAQAPAVFPLAPPEKVAPEGWSSDALADALKPGQTPEVAAPPPAPAVPERAPRVPVEPAPSEKTAATSFPQPPAPESFSTREETPAPPPPPEAQAPASQEEQSPSEPPASPVESTMLETAPPAAIVPPAEASPPRKPAHEVLDSILRRKEPGKATTKVRQKPTEAQPPPTADDAQALLTQDPRTALVPQQVTDVHEAKKAAMPGMGEVLASSALQPMTSTASASESRPLLHVPFVPVKATATEQRRARMAHLRNMGIICFLLIDVLLVVLAVLYWEQITHWWRGGPAPDPVVAAESSHVPAHSAPPVVEAAPVVAKSTPVPSKVPTVPPIAPQDAGPATVGPAVAAANPLGATQSAIPIAATPLAKAAIDPPSAAGTPTQSAGDLTIAAPSDFPTASAAANAPEKGVGAPAVPMAIPLPGHIEESIPATAPLTPQPPPPSAPPAALPTKDAPTASTLPTPPLPDAAFGALSTPAASAAPMLVPSSPLDTVPSPSLPPTMLAESPSTSSQPGISSEAPSPPAAVDAPAPKKVGKLPAEAKPALEAVEKFLAAPGWKERLPYVQKPNVVRAAMEKHAAAWGDGPIRVGSIDFLERYPSKAGVPPYCMFEVSGGELEHPVLTLVEQSPKDGVRVDWEAFVEFKDDLLLHFLEKKGSPPQKFRGLLRRKHYFDRDVPDIASKDSFELEQPNAHFEGHVFVPRNSALGKQLANQLPWGQDMPVIAELVWKSDSKAWWVQIESIVSYGWRG